MTTMREAIWGHLQDRHASTWGEPFSIMPRHDKPTSDREVACVDYIERIVLDVERRMTPPARENLWRRCVNRLTLHRQGRIVHT